LPVSPPFSEKWGLMDIILMTAHIAGTIKINTLSASLLASFPRKEGRKQVQKSKGYTKSTFSWQALFLLLK